MQLPKDVFEHITKHYYETSDPDSLIIASDGDESFYLFCKVCKKVILDLECTEN